jgi:hypothetical protein
VERRKDENGQSLDQSLKERHKVKRNYKLTEIVSRILYEQQLQCSSSLHK